MNTLEFQQGPILFRAELQRQRAIEVLQRLPLDEDRPLRMVIDCPLPSKSREQEERYHAMIGDISKQFQHCGKEWKLDDMKRILVDQFRRDTFNDPEFADLWAKMGVSEMAPSLRGEGVVLLGIQTRKFPSKLASVFIEWLYALGAELNIQWSEPKKLLQENNNDNHK